jgi:monoterpene epsilon-lactone hydrolase
MSSLQAKFIKGYVRLQRAISRPGKTLDVAKERADLEALASFFKAIIQFQTSPVTANGVMAEWITVADSVSDRVTLYLHGGSYNAGSICSHRTLAANTGWATRSRVLLINYRLAPEHPYPAALQDAAAAYQFLLAQGHRSEEIFLVGDSAGGGLAISLLLQLRDEGQRLPAALVCFSPWTDLAMKGESYISNARKDVMNNVDELWQSANLFLAGVDPRTPYASPLYGEARGLPPTLIQVGSDEVLLSDSIRWAEAAEAAGVKVCLEVWEEMQHEWQFAASLIPEGRQALEQMRDFIQNIPF